MEGKANSEMAGLYVLGARQRSLLLLDEEEWNLYEAGLILRLDTDTGTVHTCVEYRTPTNAKAGENSSTVFRSGTLVGDILYVPTSTEVLIFKLPEFQRIHYISLPCFNDVHHVVPSSDGALLAAVTGLDMVVKFSFEGIRLAEWSVLPESPWSRFSQTVDYRKVASTKPHQSHPNYVFELNGKIWATRFRQRDAICLDGSGDRISIKVESPHDGVVRGDKVYFTSVDGKLVIANRSTLQVDRIVDLNQINGQNELLGWCRGLLYVNEEMIWIGFTRIRKTRFRENVLWIKNVFREGMPEKPTHIALYDIANLRCLKVFDLEAHGMNIVYSILPVE